MRPLSLPPLLSAQHQLVDIFCDRTQHQSRGAPVGRRAPHSHALYSWGRVGGFTMTMMTVRVMEMLPRVGSLLTPGHLLAHSPSSHPCAGEGTGEKCRGPGRLRKVIKSLRILTTEQGCQIPGPQAPGLDPVMGAWEQRTGGDLGEKNAGGSGWEDFKPSDSSPPPPRSNRGSGWERWR